MKTFSVQTLGCKVNQYEGDQLAELLLARGMVPAASPARADLRVVHSCSVTIQAASKSRQTVRRATRPGGGSHDSSRAGPSGCDDAVHLDAPAVDASTGACQPVPARRDRSVALPILSHGETSALAQTATASVRPRARVVVTGCWATSDRDVAASLPGVDAVIGHDQNVAAELDRLLLLWRVTPDNKSAQPLSETSRESTPEPLADDGWMKKAGAPAGQLTPEKNQARIAPTVNENPPDPDVRAGFAGLPVLGQRRAPRQRAFLKVQDGCDAHCTYCIIPTLRSRLWSKPVDAAVEEARGLVEAGHVEIVLTGIFLGAYGQPTALRRRQPAGAGPPPLGELVGALCTRVHGLRRLRLSSVEPGDLTPELVAILRDHAQVVPHFHLPLQSGSDRLLRRMNRQYRRDGFLRMVDRVRDAFDRPALTTDVIVGFPGETDAEFEGTAEVVRQAGFIHVHAFSFSPRPGTAAARWQGEFVRGPVVNERIDALRRLAGEHDYAFRRQFVGAPVEVLIEHEAEGDGPGPVGGPADGWRHGRCERYFDVCVGGAGLRAGDLVRARVARVERGATYGEVLR